MPKTLHIKLLLFYTFGLVPITVKKSSVCFTFMGFYILMNLWPKITTFAAQKGNILPCLYLNQSTAAHDFGF